MDKKKKSLEDLKNEGLVPEWQTSEGYSTLKGGYLLNGEEPKDMYRRIAKTVAEKLKKPELESKFFDYMWNGWLCPASPVCSNIGTERGLPISCFSVYVGDSIKEIMDSITELALLSKHGGGVGMHWNDVRSRGSKISNGNGKSDGVVPFLKIQDSTTVGVSQGGVRRGASASYLSIDHGDAEEFLNIRKPQGDVNRQSLNTHHGFSISDDFMDRVLNKKDEKARKLWIETLKTRHETGEPYMFFSDNVAKNRPKIYKDLNLDVKGSNICCEILLHTDADHSFVCCLSSLNAAKYDEWKDTDLVYTSIWFLDGIMQEFIDKAKGKPGFERSVRFAEKSRALGLGLLGFHTLLQKRRIPFDHIDTFMLNAEIFRNMDKESLRASQDLAKEYGEPEWCKGYGVRNTHRIALAPTVSNSTISGNVSPSIEPWTANVFAKKSAKGTFITKNEELKILLEEKGKNTDDVWNSITSNQGSVQHLSFLTDEEKEVFATAREINQFTIIKLAGQRQRWIDQGQSINLFFPSNVDPKYFHEVHVQAWKEGLNTLYYCRTSSPLKGDSGSREYERRTVDQQEISMTEQPYSRSIDECKACEG